MKRLSMLLIPCIAISANAATFNAQGKTINSKDAKNPGIVKFEKNNAIAAKNNANKLNSLAKTATPPIVNIAYVTPYEGRFSTNDNSYSLKANGINKNVSTLNKYIQEINILEGDDVPRLTSSAHTGDIPNYIDNYYKKRSSQSADCKITSTSYNYNAFFNGVFADVLNGLKFNTTYQGSTPTHGCTGSGTYSNTCANNINIYNVVADYEPVTFTGNSCKDNKGLLNYSYRIQHHNVNQFLAAASPNATLYSFSEQVARNHGLYTTAHHFQYVGLGGFEWNFYRNSVESSTAPHVGNIMASSRKDVSSYTQEAESIDEYIYYTRSILFAAYTEEGKRTGPGTALNVITVGPANIDGYVLNRDVVTPARFHPTATGAGINKPEIYSLSYAYNSYDDFSRKIVHDNNEYEIFGITDSWGASTTASAMAADLLSKYPFYKWRPEVVKALMRTANNRGKLKKINYNNINEITSSNITNNSSSMGNVYLTQFEEMIRNNTSRYWYGNNNDFFYQDKLSFTENVDRGGKYNIAIAWLIQGQYAWENKALSSKYAFVIYDDATGRKLAENGSESIQSTLRYSEIDIPSNVSRIRVEIERTRNTGDRVILGFNMHKVTQ